MQTNTFSILWDNAHQLILQHHKSSESEKIFNNLFIKANLQPNQNIRHFSDYFQICVKRDKLNPSSALVCDMPLHAISKRLKDQSGVEASKCKSLDGLTKLLIDVTSTELSM